MTVWSTCETGNIVVERCYGRLRCRCRGLCIESCCRPAVEVCRNAQCLWFDRQRSYVTKRTPLPLFFALHRLLSAAALNPSGSLSPFSPVPLPLAVWATGAMPRYVNAVDTLLNGELRRRGGSCCRRTQT